MANYLDEAGLAELWNRCCAEFMRGGVTMQLLWKNASRYSSFAAQKISLTNLDQYNIIVIRFINEAGYERNGYATMFYNNPTVYNTSNGYLNVTAYSLLDPTRNVHRVMGIYSDGIDFDGGWLNSSANTGYMCPVEIYGIKGVTVE